MRTSSIGILIAAIGIAAASSLALAAETPSTPPAPPVAIPTFIDETAASGIESVYKGDWQYMVGGGAATLDCNGDGFPDLFLAGGENPAKFYRNASTRGGPLKFEEEKSGLELDAVTGAYPLDVDGDGITDLVVLRVGENVVMRGRGDCKFERANEAWGFDGGDGWSTAFAATFEKGNDWPTLAVGNYIDRTQDISPWGSCTDNWLHRPLAGEKRFAPPLPLKPSFCPLSMLFTDWNLSGTPSLRVSNDREYYEGGQEQMWKIEPGKPPALYTADEGWRLIRIWGMGIASYDLNGDGYPDYFLTSMADSRLQMLASIPTDGSKPKPAYAESALAKGVTAHRPYTGGDLRPSTGWHTQFADVNNDGRVDLFIAKGNVDEMPDFAAKDPNNLMLQGEDGKFTDAGEQAGIVNFKNSRGGAVVDFNLDGLLDIVAVHRRENVSLFRNTSTNAGKWVELQIDAPGANRRAIAGRLEVRCDDQTTLRRELTVGGGHVSGEDGWWHFGVGDMPTVDVRVVWPDGTADAWQTIETDNFYVLAPGKPAERWAAK